MGDASAATPRRRRRRKKHRPVPRLHPFRWWQFGVAIGFGALCMLLVIAMLASSDSNR